MAGRGGVVSTAAGPEITTLKESVAMPADSIAAQPTLEQAAAARAAREIETAIRDYPEIAEPLLSACRTYVLRIEGERRFAAMEQRLAAMERHLAAVGGGQPAREPEAPKVAKGEGKPARKTRSKPARMGKRRAVVDDELRRQVHDLRARNFSYDQIVQHLGVGSGTVGRILHSPRPVDPPMHVRFRGS
jgi:hypothetical protein